jgi:hypothetical protein
MLVLVPKSKHTQGIQPWKLQVGSECRYILSSSSIDSHRFHNSFFSETSAVHLETTCSSIIATNSQQALIV